MPQLHISSSLLQKSVLDREAERQRREVSEFLSAFVSPIPRNKNVKMLERKKTNKNFADQKSRTILMKICHMKICQLKICYVFVK